MVRALHVPATGGYTFEAFRRRSVAASRTDLKRAAESVQAA
jgi:hypothetical protein